MSNSKIACRSCGEVVVTTILSLGFTPLANSLLTAEQLNQPEPVFPLDLAFCENCSLVQITETVPPDKLFSTYSYFSSFSDTMVSHARNLVMEVMQKRQLDGNSLVMEIASNDGYLLQHYLQAGISVLGIEPAANIAQVAQDQRGIPTLREFFGAGLARRLRSEGRQADVIHAHNVLAHVADLNGFVSGLQTLLKNDGVAIIEFPYLKDMIDHCEFDTIYHEHLCYFSLSTLERLFRRHDLMVQHVQRVTIHGGSLRLFVTHSSGILQPSPSVAHMLEEELSWDVDHPRAYQNFALQVSNLKSSLLNTLQELKRDGKRLAAYGAAAKGSTLLNYCGIGRETLDFVADRSSYKQGYYMPGVHLPVLPPDALLRTMPDYVLLLTWNFADEILKQQESYRQRGGRFIIPVPEVRVV